MKGISIADCDERGILSVRLENILAYVGPRALNSSWLVKNVEAVDHDAAEALHQLSDRQATIPGNRLYELASAAGQIIEGEFLGFHGKSKRPWIILRAVDSSAFDVETDTEQVLRDLRTRFRCVHDIPSS